MLTIPHPTNQLAGQVGVAIAQGADFKTAQNIYIGFGQTNVKHVLTGLFVVSALVTTLSNGATVVAQEVDRSAKTAATLSTALTGNNNDLTFTAATAGTVGNSTTVRLVDPSANNGTLSVSVTGAAITVNLATGSGGAITSTAAQVRAAIQASAAATALVTVANKSGNDGTGVVTALAATNLAGGLEHTVVQTLVASTDLADTDSTGTVQPLTVTGGVFTGGNSLLVTVATGATATVDTKDVVATFASY